MVHLAPLPASPAENRLLADVIASACEEARSLQAAGFDAILIENFGDAPFRPARVDPHTIACMTVASRAVAAAVSLPIGINVLRNDWKAAIAIAHAVEASFVRVNVHCGVYATDQGLVEGQADDTLRYRRMLGCKAAILADVHVKHAKPLSSTDITEAAEETAYRGRADGLIVSGTATGKPTDLEDLRKVKRAVPDRPVFVGSGATPANIAELLRIADGVIVGTAIKRSGLTTARVDADQAAAFVQAARHPAG